MSETDYIELERFPDHSYYNMVPPTDEKVWERETYFPSTIRNGCCYVFFTPVVDFSRNNVQLLQAATILIIIRTETVPLNVKTL
jgi:hypothetical protein